MAILPTARLPLIEDLDVTHARRLATLEVAAAAGRAPLPLARVRLHARVADRVASVTVEQVFRNPHAEHLEAVYIFPLPGSAAVSDFEMTVGSRTIKGKVEERGEARKHYQEALDGGRRAALLEEERDDVFTVEVGNLPPGEEVAVRLTYSERLPFFEDGATEIRLPLVVAPRYIPGSPLEGEPVGGGVENDTDVVRDASRIAPPRLVDGFDPGVSLALEVALLHSDLAEGSPAISDLACSQHATRTSIASGGVTVLLARDDEPLDRDFVLRWKLAGERVRTTMLVHRSAEGTAYGLVSIVPPKREGYLGASRDVVFVVDRSGSMGGPKMASAARACSILLGTLAPRDRFAIQAFDSVVEWLTAEGSTAGTFFPASEDGLARGERFLRGISSGGGTELDGALASAIQIIEGREHGAGRIPVIVLLTDGQIGDESRVLKRIQKRLGDARVFTVGIDTAVNDGFLRRLAALGGGTATFCEPGAQLEQALRAVGREIGEPLVVNVTLDDIDGGIEMSSVAPSAVPDLFAGRATTVFFRAKGPVRARIRGRAADGLFDETVRAQEIDLPAIRHLWARMRVADLEDRFRLEPNAQHSIRREIVELSVNHAILTRFTAFVVVDGLEVVNPGGARRTVTQPVAMPARWETLGLAAPSLFAPPTLLAPSRARASAAGKGGKRHARAGNQRAQRPASAGGGSEGRIGKVADRVADMVSGVLQGRPENASREIGAPPLPQETQRVGRADVTPPAPAPNPALIARAVDDFGRAMSAARADIDTGRVPAWELLEAARAALVQVLAAWSGADALPLLQRFLRRAAVELVAAVGTPGVTIDQLRALFDRHTPDYEAAARETAAVLSGGRPAAAKPDRFWESSV